MSDVPVALTNEILALCARHCCICRRYRPLQLHVHHIVPRAEGGTNELGNLIATCVSCHSDIHTKPELTRRFTHEEQKLHRNAVYALVAEGKLPTSESSDPLALQAALATVIEGLRSGQPTKTAHSEIPANAIELLVAAAAEEARIEIQNDTWIRVGGQVFLAENEASALLEPLVTAGLVHNVGVNTFEITVPGFSVVDDLVSSHARHTAKKFKCMVCGVHFIVLTWYPDRHTGRNITCPECGQREGRFVMWQQQDFGFIFQVVPGHASPVALGSIPMAGDGETIS